VRTYPALENGPSYIGQVWARRRTERASRRSPPVALFSDLVALDDGQTALACLPLDENGYVLGGLYVDEHADENLGRWKSVRRLEWSISEPSAPAPTPKNQKGPRQMAMGARIAWVFVKNARLAVVDNCPCGRIIALLVVWRAVLRRWGCFRRCSHARWGAGSGRRGWPSPSRRAANDHCTPFGPMLRRFTRPQAWRRCEFGSSPRGEASAWIRPPVRPEWDRVAALVGGNHCYRKARFPPETARFGAGPTFLLHAPMRAEAVWPCGRTIWCGRRGRIAPQTIGRIRVATTQGAGTSARMIICHRRNHGSEAPLKRNVYDANPPPVSRSLGPFWGKKTRSGQGSPKRLSRGAVFRCD